VEGAGGDLDQGTVVWDEAEWSHDPIRRKIRCETCSPQNDLGL
jgi:hypothetical protein